MLALGRSLPWTVLRRPGMVACPGRLALVRLDHHKHVNYYDLLGVNRHASEKEIKFAYFKMAKRYHPDTNKNLDARQMFEMIAEAYEVLIDDQRRAEYDETGQAAERFGGRADGPGRHSSDATFTAEQMYSKIFGSSEEAPGSGQEENPHEDYAVSIGEVNLSREYIVKLSFEEAALGTTRHITVTFADICDKCHGSRSEMGYGGRSCPYCEGTGLETVRTGHIVARRDCTYCNGDKIFIRFKCLECEGIGRKIYERPFRLDIPPGMVNGQVLRFELRRSLLGLPEEELEEGQVRRERYLYVTVSVAESPVFTKEGLDLISQLELSPGLALLGGRMSVQGLAKPVEVKVPVGTSSHSTLVISQRGLQDANQVGDHILRTVIRVPKKLSWRQWRLARKFAALEQQQGSGTVDGLAADMDHKYAVNVIEPDRTVNSVLERRLPEQRQPEGTLNDQIRHWLGWRTQKDSKPI